MIDKEHPLPITKQCHILELSRSSVYYMPAPVSDNDRELMRLIDEIHLEEPYLGSTGHEKAYSESEAIRVGRIHVRTLMRKMGIEAHLQEASSLQAPSGSYGLSLPAAGSRHYRSQCRMVFRYHLHPHGTRILLPRRRYGLGKQEGAVLEIVEHVGRIVLCRGP